MSEEEFKFEPIPGLPDVPPEGEHILWQGTPDRWKLALRAFHIYAIAGYFGLLIVWRIVSGLSAGQSAADLVGPVAGLALAAAAAMGILTLLGWLIARSTVYTITNRRVAIRFGVALPMTFNVPFKVIRSASLKSYRDGTGDIPLALREGSKIAYLHLWPNVRPWRFTQPEPMLRAIPEAAEVATLLSNALRVHGLAVNTPKVAKAREAAPSHEGFVVAAE